MLILIVLLVFSCLALTVMSVYLLFAARPAGAVNARLETMDPSLALVENNPVTVMAERVAEPINRIVPISAVEALKLQKQLLQAGYSSPEATTAFRAIQIGLLITIPTLVLTVGFLIDRPLINFAVWGRVGAAFGYYLPKYFLIKKTTARQLRITWGLADAMDLMVVAVEAGLGLNASLNRVAEELKVLHPDLHKEL